MYLLGGLRESSNKGIKSPTFNDLGKFLSEHPTIRRIVFNGKSEPAYESARTKYGIPREMCVDLRQTSGRVKSRGQEDIEAWKKAFSL